MTIEQLFFEGQCKREQCQARLSSAECSLSSIFYQLIQVAIGTRICLSHTPSADEWGELYAIAKKQSLVGVCFAGVQKTLSNSPFRSTGSGQVLGKDPSAIGMSELQYLTWMGMAAKIQQRNEIMNGYTHKALTYFRAKGFPCQVLKGQGVAKLYGSLAGLRQSGDVDVWLSCGRKRLYDFARKDFGKIEGLNYYHIHCPIIEDTVVEAHVWPSYLTNPFKNRKLHQFSIEYQPTVGCADTPDKVFDGVFIMLHCYRHFCGRGVGMRQVLDYYFVLKTLSDSPSKGEERVEVLKWIKALGMYRFATAMMWVLKDIFGLDEKYLICECNEKEGRFLLDEVMNTGNMGRGESRFKRDDSNAVLRFISNQRKNLHLLTHYPGEVCWSPFFNLARYFWQLTVKKQ